MRSGSAASPVGVIHRFVRGTDESKAPLLLLHRTGGDETDFLDDAAKISPGASLLGIRGPVIEEGRARFFRRVAPGKFDFDDLAYRIEQLALFLEWAKGEYGMGLPVGFGFSNGANMIWTLLLSRPQALRGAILLRPMRAFEPDKVARLADIPVLVIAGRHDSTVPPSRANEIPDLLRSAGAEVQLQWADAAHDFVPEDSEKSAAWLSRLNAGMA